MHRRPTTSSKSGSNMSTLVLDQTTRTATISSYRQVCVVCPYAQLVHGLRSCRQKYFRPFTAGESTPNRCFYFAYIYNTGVHTCVLPFALLPAAAGYRGTSALMSCPKETNLSCCSDGQWELCHTKACLVSKIFKDSPSHRIFGRMHRALNINRTNN
jgi:hypothetical protein